MVVIGTIGLGSNLGDRSEHLCLGLLGLERAGLELWAVSSVWETEPVDVVGGLWFFNMAVKFSTSRDPHLLLDDLQRIELAQGRLRQVQNGPRTLDLDLLTLSDLQLRSDRLQLPHPRMWRRRFVLEPLAEVAPELCNPATGRTIAQEVALLAGAESVSRIGRLASAGALPL